MAWVNEGASQRELSLAKNELVLVIRRKKEYLLRCVWCSDTLMFDRRWWKGVRASDGKQGWFPRTRLVAVRCVFVYADDSEFIANALF